MGAEDGLNPGRTKACTRRSSNAEVQPMTPSGFSASFWLNMIRARFALSRGKTGTHPGQAQSVLFRIRCCLLFQKARPDIHRRGAGSVESSVKIGKVTKTSVVGNRAHLLPQTGARRAWGVGRGGARKGEVGARGAIALNGAASPRCAPTVPTKFPGYILDIGLATKRTPPPCADASASRVAPSASAARSCTWVAT